MAYSLKVKGAKRDTVLADGVDFIEVEFSVLNGKKAVETRKQGFPLGTSEKKISDTLQRYLDQYVTEREAAEVQAEREAELVVADETIISVHDIELNHEESTPKRKG